MSRPQLKWQIPLQNTTPMAVKADEDENILYVALKEGGIGVIEYGESRPKELARISIGQFDDLHVTNLDLQGDQLLVSLGDHFHANGSRLGIAHVSVANPKSPVVKSLWTSEKKMKGSAMPLSWGDSAFLACMNEGVMFFESVDDLNNPKTIVLDRHFPKKNPNSISEPNARGLAVRGEYLYVCNDAGGLRIVSLKEDSFGVEIGKYVNEEMRNKNQAYNNLILDGDLAYIAVDYGGLEIVDISDPKEMKQAGWWNPWDAHLLRNLWFNSEGHTNQIVYDKSKKVVYLSAGDSELVVVDVKNPAKPVQLPGFGQPKNNQAVWGMTKKGDLAFLSYINAYVPFRGTWTGLKAVQVE